MDRIDPMNRSSSRHPAPFHDRSCMRAEEQASANASHTIPTRRPPKDALHQRLWIDPTVLEVTRLSQSCMLLRNSSPADRHAIQHRSRDVDTKKDDAESSRDEERSRGIERPA
ncbi:MULTISPECIES: hypothetical protein [Xanthomonas]|uniref:hypothetical protein n=1 Tax=Xanthomonas TaxID=338 RepID=UPI001263B8C6|nr:MULTISPECIES: hypothetical protein [Xanthomonas]